MFRLSWRRRSSKTPRYCTTNSIVHANGTDYLIGRQTNATNFSQIKIFRGQPAPWSEVANTILEVLDMDAVAYDDKIYVAILHRLEALGSYQHRINVYEFDPQDQSFEDISQIGTVGNDDGTHNGSISMAFNDNVSIIASVSDNTLRLHEFTDLDFSTGDNKLEADAFPNALYNHMRTHVDEDDGLHVAFTHCALEQSVCRNNRLRYVTKGAGDDDWAPAGNSNYNNGFGSQDCNKLTGYDAYLGADSPVVTMSYRSNCDNTSDPKS